MHEMSQIHTLCNWDSDVSQNLDFTSIHIPNLQYTFLYNEFVFRNWSLLNLMACRLQKVQLLY